MRTFMRTRVFIAYRIEMNREKKKTTKTTYLLNQKTHLNDFNKTNDQDNKIT